MNLKGRENLYKKEAIELLRRFQTDVGEVNWSENCLFFPFFYSNLFSVQMYLLGHLAITLIFSIGIISKFQDLHFVIVLQLATEESKNFAERNIYLVLIPNKIAIQKEQDGLNKKDTGTEEKDESDSDEPLTEELEESIEPEAEVSANV